MKSSTTLMINLILLIQTLFIILAKSQDFDFYYFVQQWPGSYCDTRRSCCYPTTGKPDEDFGIHGLWPNYDTGAWPSMCDPDSKFDPSKISDLRSKMQKNWPTLACPSADGTRFWGHEWEKHGTCSSLDQHSYFEAALKLKRNANLLQNLLLAGIRPGDFYSLESIKGAIINGIGLEPYIECNVDAAQNQQLYQVYLCVDVTASNFIDCPVSPHGRPCGSRIEFPSFSSNSSIRSEI